MEPSVVLAPTSSNQASPQPPPPLPAPQQQQQQQPAPQTQTSQLQISQTAAGTTNGININTTTPTNLSNDTAATTPPQPPPPPPHQQQQQQQQQPSSPPSATTTAITTTPPTITALTTNDTTSLQLRTDDDHNTSAASTIGPIKPKRSRKKKQQKDNKHKMITGYIIYASEIRKEVIKKYPEKDFGNISKLVGIEWKNLPQETKVAYEKRAQEQNNVSRMLNEKAEAALELMKLADTAVEQQQQQQQQQQQNHQHQIQMQQHSNTSSANSLHEQHSKHQPIQARPDASAPSATSEQYHNQQAQLHPHQLQLHTHHHHLSQQQVANFMAEHHNQQHHHQSPLPSTDPCNPSISNLSCNGGQNDIDVNNNANGLGIDRASVAQHYDMSFVHQQPQQQLIAQSYPTAQFAQDFYYNYGQSPSMSIPYMNQSTPIIARLINDNHDASSLPQPPLAQQQPMQIVHHQQQQPVTTMVQYCNGSCCFANGSRPYPAAITPTQSPAPNYPYPPLPASAPLQSRRNNIVYRKPTVVRLRPKDASTQTDPIKWADKITAEQPKKALKFSQKFIDYLNCNTNMPHQMLVSDIDEKIV